MNHGISILHGPHQVAQKSRRITLPLNDDSLTSLFDRSFSVKLRFAGLASAGQALAATPALPGPPAAATPRCGHSKSAFNVSSASASALTEAIPHRIRVVMRDVLTS